MITPKQTEHGAANHAATEPERRGGGRKNERREQIALVL
jgi:hypothetical protein